MRWRYLRNVCGYAARLDHLSYNMFKVLRYTGYFRFTGQHFDFGLSAEVGQCAVGDEYVGYTLLCIISPLNPTT